MFRLGSRVAVVLILLCLCQGPLLACASSRLLRDANVVSVDPKLQACYDAAEQYLKSALATLKAAYAQCLAQLKSAPRGTYAARLKACGDTLAAATAAAKVEAEKGLKACCAAVHDTHKPTVTITCPTEPVPSNYVLVVTASDLEDGPLTPSCTNIPANGYPVGNTVVTCTATDKAGNTADPVTAPSQWLNQTPPVIHLPSS